MTTVDATTGELQVEPLAAAPTLSPTSSLAVMREAADAFRQISTTVDLFAIVQGGAKHLTVEGYQTIALLVGVTATVTATVRDADGWKATAEARRLSDGMVVGAADALCSKSERRWSRADDYAILSMASTRAQSRALRAVVAPIVKLADPSIQTTAAEEMPDAQVSQTASPASRSTASPARPASTSRGAVSSSNAGGADRPITEKQIGLVKARQRSAKMTDRRLLEAMFAGTGNTAPPETSASHTSALLERALTRFPAAKLDVLLDAISATGSGAA